MPRRPGPAAPSLGLTAPFLVWPALLQILGLGQPDRQQLNRLGHRALTSGPNSQPTCAPRLVMQLINLCASA